MPSWESSATLYIPIHVIYSMPTLFEVIVLPRPSSSAAMAACLSLTMQGGRCNDEHGFCGNNLDQEVAHKPPANDS